MPGGEKENQVELNEWLRMAADSVAQWQSSYPAFEQHASLRVDHHKFFSTFEEFSERMRGNYPYFHPSYAGQMLKPPHPAAVVWLPGRDAGQPEQSRALDGGKITSEFEKEAVAQLAAMFGLGQHLGHLTSSGTIANLEALYVARELHPGRGVAYSAEAHYTQSRMCGLLGVPGTEVPVDGLGQLDLEGARRAPRRADRSGRWSRRPGRPASGRSTRCTRYWPSPGGTVCGCIVDAAYVAGSSRCWPVPRAGLAWIRRRGRAIAAECDSVVVDPHKHGLQPYGCGAVLFTDPAVGRFYAHDSPYTYFTSSELHLGEISLECSRAGAAAAALWLTLRLLPLRAGEGGLGAVLAACREAALDWAELLGSSEVLEVYQAPQLDIVTYFPVTSPASLAAIDEVSARIMADGMNDAERPVFVSTLSVTADALARRHPEITADRARARILRSVLMKPESHPHIPWLHARLEELAR